MEVTKLSFTVRKIKDYRFIDILVDGKSMYDILEINGSGMSTILNTRFTEQNINEFIAMLKGTFSDPDLRTGITPFYVCGECGDYGCGVMGWHVKYDTDFYTWSAFSWDDNLGDEDFSEDTKDMAPIQFSTSEYEHALLEVAQAHEAMSARS